MKSAWQFFMNFRGPKAHPNRFEKPPRGVGSEPGDRQDWQRISGKMRRKSMPVLSVPGALVGGDEVTMAVFHELSRAEGPSQQGRRTPPTSELTLLPHFDFMQPVGALEDFARLAAVRRTDDAVALHAIQNARGA